MEKLAVIALLVSLSVLRLYYKLRFHALSGVKAFRYEPAWIIIIRYVLGTAMIASLARYLLTGTRVGAGSIADLSAAAWAGFASSIAGLALLFSTHRALDGNFSTTIDVGEDRKLVTEGPYAFVRHPMYLAYLAFFLGMLLLSGDPLFGGTGMLIILSLMVLRVRYEERLLRDRFGEEYENYRRRVGAFIPRPQSTTGTRNPADGPGR